MMYQIEKNVPIPSPTQLGRKRMYPFAEMEVGDSLFIPNKQTNSVSASLVRYKTEGKQFTLRTMVEHGVKGVRVWRVK